MTKVAFELRSDVEDFSGGSVSLAPDAEVYDVGEALQKSDGKIVLDPTPKNDSESEVERAAKDAAIVEALRNHPALQATTAGGKAKQSAASSQPAEEEKP